MLHGQCLLNGIQEDTAALEQEDTAHFCGWSNLATRVDTQGDSTAKQQQGDSTARQFCRAQDVRIANACTTSVGTNLTMDFLQ